MKQFVTNIFANIGITDVLDILIVAVLIYAVLGFIRETRAEQLAKGIIILVLFTVIARWAHLYTVHWILNGILSVGIIAIIVIFQPELRRVLEFIGRSRIYSTIKGMDIDDAQKSVAIFTDAIFDMSQKRTGALMVFERETLLSEIIETGTTLDSKLSEELIENIFYEGAPLHDGAMIIRDNRIYAAGCVLPLTQNKKLSKDLGTRHRAGIGITEVSDALTVIVSEETGIVSIAQDGKLNRRLDRKEVERRLLSIFIVESSETPYQKFRRILKSFIKGGNRNVE